MEGEGHGHRGHPGLQVEADGQEEAAAIGDADQVVDGGEEEVEPWVAKDKIVNYI